MLQASTSPIIGDMKDLILHTVNNLVLAYEQKAELISPGSEALVAVFTVEAIFAPFPREDVGKKSNPVHFLDGFHLSILVLAGDPGGGAALVPVLQQLISEQKTNVLVYAYRQSANLFRQQKIPFLELTETTTIDDCRSLLDRHRPKSF